MKLFIAGGPIESGKKVEMPSAGANTTVAEVIAHVESEIGGTEISSQFGAFLCEKNPETGKFFPHPQELPLTMTLQNSGMKVPLIMLKLRDPSLSMERSNSISQRAASFREASLGGNSLINTSFQSTDAAPLSPSNAMNDPLNSSISSQSSINSVNNAIASASQTHFARVTAMFKKYDPAKLDNVEPLLAKYKGREEEVIGALVKKYGPEPAASMRASATSSPVKVVAKRYQLSADENERMMVGDDYQGRLMAIFKRFEPAKATAAHIKSFLDVATGKENEVLTALVMKYCQGETKRLQAEAAGTATYDKNWPLPHDFAIPTSGAYVTAYELCQSMYGFDPHDAYTAVNDSETRGLLRQYVKVCQNTIQTMGSDPDQLDKMLMWANKFNAFTFVNSAQIHRAEPWEARAKLTRSLIESFGSQSLSTVFPIHEYKPADPNSLRVVDENGELSDKDGSSIADLPEAGQTFFRPSDGVVCHVWQNEDLCKRFTRSINTLWETLFEHRLTLNGMLRAPVVCSMMYKCYPVTLMPIVPVNPGCGPRIYEQPYRMTAQGDELDACLELVSRSMHSECLVEGQQYNPSRSSSFASFQGEEEDLENHTDQIFPNTDDPTTIYTFGSAENCVYLFSARAQYLKIDDTKTVYARLPIFEYIVAANGSTVGPTTACASLMSTTPLPPPAAINKKLNAIDSGHLRSLLTTNVVPFVATGLVGDIELRIARGDAGNDATRFILELFQSNLLVRHMHTHGVNIRLLPLVDESIQMVMKDAVDARAAACKLAAKLVEIEMISRTLKRMAVADLRVNSSGDDAENALRMTGLIAMVMGNVESFWKDVQVVMKRKFHIPGGRELKSIPANAIFGKIALMTLQAKCGCLVQPRTRHVSEVSWCSNECASMHPPQIVKMGMLDQYPGTAEQSKRDWEAALATKPDVGPKKSNAGMEDVSSGLRKELFVRLSRAATLSASARRATAEQLSKVHTMLSKVAPQLPRPMRSVLAAVLNDLCQNGVASDDARSYALNLLTKEIDILMGEHKAKVFPQFVVPIASRRCAKALFAFNQIPTTLRSATTTSGLLRLAHLYPSAQDIEDYELTRSIPGAGAIETASPAETYYGSNGFCRNAAEASAKAMATPEMLETTTPEDLCVIFRVAGAASLCMVDSSRIMNHRRDKVESQVLTLVSSALLTSNAAQKVYPAKLLSYTTSSAEMVNTVSFSTRNSPVWIAAEEHWMEAQRAKFATASSTEPPVFQMPELDGNIIARNCSQSALSCFMALVMCLAATGKHGSVETIYDRENVQRLRQTLSEIMSAKLPQQEEMATANVNFVTQWDAVVLELVELALSDELTKVGGDEGDCTPSAVAFNAINTAIPLLGNAQLVTIVAQDTIASVQRYTSMWRSAKKIQDRMRYRLVCKKMQHGESVDCSSAFAPTAETFDRMKADLEREALHTFPTGLYLARGIFMLRLQFQQINAVEAAERTRILSAEQHALESFKSMATEQRNTVELDAMEAAEKRQREEEAQALLTEHTNQRSTLVDEEENTRAIDLVGAEETAFNDLQQQVLGEWWAIASVGLETQETAARNILEEEQEREMDTLADDAQRRENELLHAQKASTPVTAAVTTSAQNEENDGPETGVTGEGPDEQQEEPADEPPPTSIATSPPQEEEHRKEQQDLVKVEMIQREDSVTRWEDSEFRAILKQFEEELAALLAKWKEHLDRAECERLDLEDGETDQRRQICSEQERHWSTLHDQDAASKAALVDALKKKNLEELQHLVEEESTARRSSVESPQEDAFSEFVEEWSMVALAAQGEQQERADAAAKLALEDEETRARQEEISAPAEEFFAALAQDAENERRWIADRHAAREALLTEATAALQCNQEEEQAAWQDVVQAEQQSRIDIGGAEATRIVHTEQRQGVEKEETTARTTIQQQELELFGTECATPFFQQGSAIIEANEDSSRYPLSFTEDKDWQSLEKAHFQQVAFLTAMEQLSADEPKERVAMEASNDTEHAELMKAHEDGKCCASTFATERTQRQDLQRDENGAWNQLQLVEKAEAAVVGTQADESHRWDRMMAMEVKRRDNLNQAVADEHEQELHSEREAVAAAESEARSALVREARDTKVELAADFKAVRKAWIAWKKSQEVEVTDLLEEEHRKREVDIAAVARRKLTKLHQQFLDERKELANARRATLQRSSTLKRRQSLPRRKASVVPKEATPQQSSTEKSLVVESVERAASVDIDEPADNAAVEEEPTPQTSHTAAAPAPLEEQRQPSEDHHDAEMLHSNAMTPWLSWLVEHGGGGAEMMPYAAIVCACGATPHTAISKADAPVRRDLRQMRGNVVSTPNTMRRRIELLPYFDACVRLERAKIASVIDSWSASPTKGDGPVNPNHQHSKDMGNVRAHLNFTNVSDLLKDVEHERVESQSEKLLHTHQGVVSSQEVFELANDAYAHSHSHVKVAPLSEEQRDLLDQQRVQETKKQKLLKQKHVPQRDNKATKLPPLRKEFVSPVKTISPSKQQHAGDGPFEVYARRARESPTTTSPARAREWACSPSLATAISALHSEWARQNQQEHHASSVAPLPPIDAKKTELTQQDKARKHTSVIHHPERHVDQVKFSELMPKRSNTTMDAPVGKAKGPTALSKNQSVIGRGEMPPRAKASSVPLVKKKNTGLTLEPPVSTHSGPKKVGNPKKQKIVKSTDIFMKGTLMREERRKWKCLPKLKECMDELEAVEDPISAQKRQEEERHQRVKMEGFRRQTKKRLEAQEKETEDLITDTMYAIEADMLAM